MFDVFRNRANVTAVFGLYSLVEAVRVKKNIDIALSELKLPSQAVLDQMMAEGLSVDEFNVGASDEVENSVADASSDVVLRKHLHAAFLDIEALREAFSGFSMTQGVKLRQLFEECSPSLRLPSDSLMSMMEGEGLSMQELGIIDEQKLKAKASGIAQKLAAHKPADEDDKVAKAKAALGQALAPNGSEKNKLDDIKARLSGALQSKPQQQDTQNDTVPVDDGEAEQVGSPSLIPFPARNVG
ncbi:hypothetical protein ACFSJ3_00565 [Corallincola platygyrae]|uniref:Uncharacterized protein n=1 Tax=Corallincola platygyrae TaxID=1193278 RepID=A0ABW4XG38_9GAMM